MEQEVSRESTTGEALHEPSQFERMIELQANLIHYQAKLQLAMEMEGFWEAQIKELNSRVDRIKELIGDLNDGQTEFEIG